MKKTCSVMIHSKVSNFGRNVFTLGELLDKLHEMKVLGVPEGAAVNPRKDPFGNLGKVFLVEWEEDQGSI